VGTASLIFGLIAIGFGVFIAFDMLSKPDGSESPGLNFLIGLSLTAILLAIGGLLLRKFDRDRKKEKLV